MLLPCHAVFFSVAMVDCPLAMDLNLFYSYGPLPYVVSRTSISTTLLTSTTQMLWLPHSLGTIQVSIIAALRSLQISSLECLKFLVKPLWLDALDAHPSLLSKPNISDIDILPKEQAFRRWPSWAIHITHFLMSAENITEELSTSTCGCTKCSMCDVSKWVHWGNVVSLMKRRL